MKGNFWHKYNITYDHDDTTEVWYRSGLSCKDVLILKCITKQLNAPKEAILHHIAKTLGMKIIKMEEE